MAEEIKHFVSSPSGTKGLMDAIPKYKSPTADPEHISEAQRLDFPCEEPIDLRELFPSQCTALAQGGITHFLDIQAKRFYLRQLKRNNEHYTQAIYEAVLKHAAARLASGLDGKQGKQSDETEENLKTYNPPAVIPVGYSQHRAENRLNYASDVEIELPSGKIIQGRSVNVSLSGIQIKLHYLLDVIDGMEMQLAFPSLEEKYQQDFGMVPYSLMKSSVGSMHMTLQLARIDPGEHPFDIFIQEFIDNKKHRYRIDAEDSKLALTAKAWEYFYINSLPYLACFIATRGEKLQIQEIAISNQNKQYLKGLGNSMLSILEQQMSSFRLNSVVHHEITSPEIYAYRYQGSGLRRRIGATSWQFIDNTSKLSFLRTGIKEDTFVAWKINVVKLQNMSEQRSKELIDKLADTSADQADNLIDQLNQYEYLIYLVDITDSLKKDPLLKDETFTAPEDSFFDDYEIKRSTSMEYTRLRLGITKQRNEDRYIYQSAIVLKYYGEKIKGHTLDLSVNGLKIKLDKSNTFQIRDTVTIDFIGLNKRFRSSKLKNQSYRIAAITKDGSLCLTRDHRIARHDAAIFIHKLLNKNKNTLPSCTGELWMSTKSRLIESWLNLCLPTQSLLMTRIDGKYDIPYVLAGNYTSQLLAPFQIGRDLYNFEQIFDCPDLKEKLRGLDITSNRAPTIEIYVSQQTASDGGSMPSIEIKTWADFEDDIERVEYIQRSSRKPLFGFYSLTLCRVPRLEKSYLLEDMNVIRRNARHRLTEFETEYQSLVVVMELTDRTNLVLERYNLTKT